MINYFYMYIKNIIFFLIIISFIQVILPTNKYRSYINLVFGMMLIFIMIKPLNLIFDNIKNIDVLTIFNEENLTENINIDIKKYENIQNDLVKNAFKENIKSQIKTILKDKYTIKNIDIEIYENKYMEITINKIYMNLQENNNKVYVKPFNEDNSLKYKELNAIKKDISNLYDIKEEQIVISFE